jgi:hypothetical protein
MPAAGSRIQMEADPAPRPVLRLACLALQGLDGIEDAL